MAGHHMGLGVRMYTDLPGQLQCSEAAGNGDGLMAADRRGLEICDQTLPAARFLGVGGRVTAAEAAFIAERLQQALDGNLIGDLLGFFDEHPGEPAVRGWVNEFVDLNQRAAGDDGYYIV